MSISTRIMRTILIMSALMCATSFEGRAKDYSTTLADNIDVVYAVNTTDLIARVKRVQNYNTSMVAKVEVPKTIRYKSGNKTYTLTVTKIGDGAFDNVENIKSVVLPNTITHIGDDAFNFSYVESVNLPKNLVSIGDRAFYTAGIKSATIPGSCKTIGKQAFANSDIETLSFEESSTPLSIGEKAFEFVTVRNVTLPARVSKIGNGAFADCRWLQTVAIMAATVIPDDCFNYCISLHSIGLPASVTSIGDRAFYDCWRLSSIPWLPNLKTIGNSAFQICGLTAVNLSEGLVAIGRSAFQSNESLEYVSLPSTLLSIGDNCFSGCENLKRMECDASIPPAITLPCFSIVQGKVLAYVPSQSVAAYRAAAGWSLFDYSHYDPSGVESALPDGHSPEVRWYDLYGNPLPYAPSCPGIYIKVSDNKSSRVLIR